MESRKMRSSGIEYYELTMLDMWLNLLIHVEKHPNMVCADDPVYRYRPSGSPSLFVFSTRSLAARKSSMLTLIRRSRSAKRPASEQMALISAPDKSSFWLMNSSRSTSSLRDILEVWSVKIFFLVDSVTVSVYHAHGVRADLRSGFSKRIFRSIRPGRIKAGSSVSILLVAIMTLTSPRSSKPSSWLSNSNMVR
jgi:hypothetical protein